MSTNFYLHPSSKPVAPFAVEPIHIGKSSKGWAFALRIYPSANEYSMLPRSFSDWVRLFMRSDVEIRDEAQFSRTYSADRMIEIICERAVTNRCAIDNDHCVGHGGTWDLIARDFS